MIDNYITQICGTLGVEPGAIAYKNTTVTLLYSEIISRILLASPTVTVMDLFPDTPGNFAKVTLRKLLALKPPRVKYSNYLFGLLGLKKCSECGTIHPTEYFPQNYGTCKFCRSISNKLYSAENRDTISIRRKEYYLTHKEQENSGSRAYHAANRDFVLSRQKTYRESHRAEFKAWKLKYKTRKTQATPPWANMSKMNEIYTKRKEGEHVDHIIPLQGELVSGLHCEFNLQILSVAENLSKSNKFNPETYVHEVPNY